MLRRHFAAGPGVHFFVTGLFLQNCVTIPEIADHARQIERLWEKWFIGHEAWDATGVLGQISRGDRPAFDCSPAKDDRDVEVFAMQSEPASVLVGKIEWQKQLLTIFQVGEQSDPLSNQLHGACGGAEIMILAGWLESKIVTFPGAGFAADVDLDLIVGV